MTSGENPYRPPRHAADAPRSWRRLRKVLHAVLRIQGPRFGRGDAVICEGISFFIDPDRSDVLFAATPSTDIGSSRVHFIADEVTRVLRVFISDYPNLHQCIVGRRVVVRIINQYTDPQTNFVKEFETSLNVPAESRGVV